MTNEVTIANAIAETNDILAKHMIEQSNEIVSLKVKNKLLELDLEECRKALCENCKYKEAEFDYCKDCYWTMKDKIKKEQQKEKFLCALH